MERFLQKLALLIFWPRYKKSEQTIGYKLIFRNVPDRFISSYMQWDMTKQFRRFGLHIAAGTDYWTMGKIINGVSTRYDSKSDEYQSWLGGYIVKLAKPEQWNPKDCFRLAIVDQNDWLNLYGDPRPFTSTEGWEFTEVQEITVGEHQGKLYKAGCTTHSDVGEGGQSWKLPFITAVIAGFLNHQNPKLKLTSKMFIPKTIASSYETLKLVGYIAVLELPDNVKVVLYGNAADEARFDLIKADLKAAMQNCEIVGI